MSKILIIDDDEAIRTMVSEILQMEGFEILSAENGLKGIQIARAHLPDLIISDINMEEMDGYTLLKELKQEPSTSTIPVILITGDASRTGMRHGMELGADDYIDKPFTYSELVAAVNARLEKRQMVIQQVEEKLDKLRHQLSSTLPHEFQTPLTSILAFSELILSDSQSLKPEMLTEMAQAIHRGGKRLLRLFENYLLYSRLEIFSTDANRIEELRNKSTSDVRSIITAAAQEKAETVARSNDLSLDLCDASIAISSEYLEKIALELLDNAFKFSEPGTPVKVSANIVNGEFALSVSDEGRGIKSEDLTGIGAYMQFERNIYEQQGSGMGLAIVKRLAELHGGSFTITSKPDAGATVSVRFHVISD